LMRIVPYFLPPFLNCICQLVAPVHHIPPLDRVNRDEVFELIEQKRYFILHAPRQTGKTSVLRALMKELNEAGHYRSVYVNIEGAQAAREDLRAAMQTILSVLSSSAMDHLDDSFVENNWQSILETSGPHDALRSLLRHWAQADCRPLVVMIDEVDALIGDTLISVLRQLRTGYAERPKHFPQCVILCGIRDVRDYRIHSSAEKQLSLGAVHSTLRPSRCGWTTSAKPRPTHSCFSTPTALASAGARLLWPRCGPRLRGSHGWSMHWRQRH